jgi:hypothetical protein
LGLGKLTMASTKAGSWLWSSGLTIYPKYLIVLKLERQDHLFFKTKIGDELLSFTDGVMSGIDGKLRFDLMHKKTQNNEWMDQFFGNKNIVSEIYISL